MQQEAARRKLPLPKSVLTGMYEGEAVNRGLTIYKSFANFVGAHEPQLLDHAYMRRMINVAERVIAGQIKRLLVLLPTQYGKSSLWSKLLPAYYLLRHPSHVVGMASYGADLAWELSGDARDYYAASGGLFKEGASAKGSVRHWKTMRRSGARGGMWATGIGGPSLGRGWNLGIVDDPIDPEQVTRAAYQRRFARWWPSKWLRGQRPGGSPLVFIMQRLAVDDPVAWLLSREETGAAEHWHILAMDEIHSSEPFGRWEGPLGFPKTCTVEPDPRPVGALLAPKFRGRREVELLHATTGSVIAGAMRQQRPMRPTGDFWPLKGFEDRTYETLPKDAYNGGWDFDTAYTKAEENSASAGVKSFRGPGDIKTCRVYIEDCWWDWLEFPALVKTLQNLFGPHYVEKKASGKSVVQALKTYGVVATEVPVFGDKLARASAAQPAVTSGRVYVNKLVYDKLLYGEGQGLLRITAEALSSEGEGLDLNDAFVQTIHRHLEIGSKRNKIAFA